MIVSLLQMIPSDAVAGRHYFLEALQADPLVWCIRIIGILIVVILFVLYQIMKKRDGE